MSIYKQCVSLLHGGQLTSKDAAELVGLLMLEVHLAVIPFMLMQLSFLTQMILHTDLEPNFAKQNIYCSSQTVCQSCSLSVHLAFCLYIVSVYPSVQKYICPPICHPPYLFHLQLYLFVQLMTVYPSVFCFMDSLHKYSHQIEHFPSVFLQFPYL